MLPITAVREDGIVPAAFHCPHCGENREGELQINPQTNLFECQSCDWAWWSITDPQARGMVSDV